MSIMLEAEKLPTHFLSTTERQTLFSNLGGIAGIEQAQITLQATLEDDCRTSASKW